MIIPVYQPLGSSTHLLAQKIGKKVFQKTGDPDDLKATHTGTLDPMAEGVVIVLTGKDRFDKDKVNRKAREGALGQKYGNWKKEYRFQILWGVETDSHDLLGLNTSMEYSRIAVWQYEGTLEKKLGKILPRFVGKQLQTLPLFSAKRIDGESYFDKAKRGEKVVADSQKIEVFDLEIIENLAFSIRDLKKSIIGKISLIKGDFRQSEILKSWDKTFSKLEENNITKLPITTLTATTSKRTYIRGLVRDLSQKIGIPATTFSIVRTRNREYGVENCKTFPKIST